MSRGDPMQVADADRLTLRPWDPQPGEPATSFAGLVLYRESLAPAAQPAERRAAPRSFPIDRRAPFQPLATGHTDAGMGRRTGAATRAQHARQVEADWVQRHADAGKKLQALGLAGLGPGAGTRRGWPAWRPERLKPQELIRMIVAGSRSGGGGRIPCGGNTGSGIRPAASRDLRRCIHGGKPS